jgi:hypothetical protein
MIIDVYVKAAIEMARSHFAQPAFAICPEYNLSSVDLGVDGLRNVSGRVDYATSILHTGIETRNPPLTTVQILL